MAIINLCFIITWLLIVIFSFFRLNLIIRTYQKTIENYHKTIENYHKIIDNIKGNIGHLFILTDTLRSGSCSPMHRTLYDRLRVLKPEEAVKALENRDTLIKQISSEGYAKTREMLKEIIEKTEDPIRLKRFEGTIEELDGIFNLLDSIDENTSQDHVIQIMDNVGMSIQKLRDKGLDIEIGGF